MNRPLSLALAFTFALTGCASVPAPSLDEIVAMAKAGQPASAIVAAIDAGDGVYPLGAAELVALARAGVPEPVLEHLLTTRIDLERQRAFWYAVATNPWPTTRYGVMPVLPPLAPVVAPLPTPVASAAPDEALRAEASAPVESSGTVTSATVTPDPDLARAAPVVVAAATRVMPTEPAAPISPAATTPDSTTPEALADATGMAVAPEQPVTLPAPEALDPEPANPAPASAATAAAEPALAAPAPAAAAH